MLTAVFIQHRPYSCLYTTPLSQLSLYSTVLTAVFRQYRPYSCLYPVPSPQLSLHSNVLTAVFRQYLPQSCLYIVCIQHPTHSCLYTALLPQLPVSRIITQLSYPPSLCCLSPSGCKGRILEKCVPPARSLFPPRCPPLALFCLSSFSLFVCLLFISPSLTVFN